jgi:dihydrofolate synthase/folylpolyglutamate synthase
MLNDRTAALQFLESFLDYERAPPARYTPDAFRLARMRSLLEALGRPDIGLPVIHIAGTKGKGSTAAMVASVLTSAGYRTGLYTSPHLERLEERFQIDGRPCSGDELLDLVRHVARVPWVAAPESEPDQTTHRGDTPGGPGRPTFFELVTAMAWLYFRQQQADVAVLEVGLGGRLDSTNVCQPDVCVITTISLDHTRQLGDTAAKIAREKAGIIKRGVPVISGVLPDEPRSVIDEVCRQQHSELWQLGRDFHFAYTPPAALDEGPARGRADVTFSLPQAAGRIEQLELGLPGRHQAANAAVAVATLRRLQLRGWNIDEAAVRRGLADVQCPARIEVVARRPTVVLDAAHNTASIAALVETLQESFSPRGRRILLLAVSSDKDVAGMLDLLLPQFTDVLCTRFTHNPRSRDPHDLVRLAAQRGFAAQAHPTPAQAWEAARRLATPEALLCITGSFFFAAEMRPLLAAYPVQPPVGGPRDESLCADGQR